MKIRITKIDYTPKSGHSDIKKKALTVLMRGIDENGDSVGILIDGTQPRFWTARKPGFVNAPAHVMNRITDIQPSGKGLNGEQLWEIRVKFPFDVPEVRDYFEPHFQADIVYDVAVRQFYGWKDTVEVPDDYKGRSLHVNEIKPADDLDVKFHAYAFDIENLDSLDVKYAPAPVTCATFVDVNSGEAWHVTTKKVDKVEIGKKLAENDMDMPVHIQMYDRGSMEQREKRLMWWIADFLDGKITGNAVTHIIGHNSGDGEVRDRGFDIPYLTNRCKRLNTNLSKRMSRSGRIERMYPSLGVHFSMVQQIDTMHRYKRMVVKEVASVALDFICKKELGYGKIDIGESCTSLYETNPTLLSAYNIWDSVLVERLVNKMGMLDLFADLATYYGTPINKTTVLNLWESMAIRHYNAQGVYLPSKKFIKTPKEKIQGADVGGGAKGLYKWVIALDNKSEYPACILTANMGYTTRIRDKSIPEYKTIKQRDDIIAKLPLGCVVTPRGNIYDVTKQDFIVEKLRELWDLRDSIKAWGRTLDPDSEEYRRLDIRQNAVKIAMNGLYGAVTSGTTKKTAHAPFRLLDQQIGADVTDLGRRHLAWNREKINSAEIDGFRFKVIYWDTDSTYTIIQNCPEDITKEKVQELALKLETILNDSYNDMALEFLGPNVFLTDEIKWKVKTDAIYDRFYAWGTDKKYAYREGDRIGWKGIGRSDVPPLSGQMMEELLTAILHDKTSREELKEIVEKKLEEISSGERDIDIGVPRTVNSKGNYAFKAMEWSNKYLRKRMKLGDKVRIYPVKAVRGFPTPEGGRVALNRGDNPRDFGLVLDYEKIIDLAIVNYLDTNRKKAMSKTDEKHGLLWGLGLTFGELRKGKDAKLEDFV